MICRKNVAGWEQILRIVAGAAMITCGLIGSAGNPVGYLIAAAGVVTGLTDIFGYCPASAMAGRRLAERSPS
jgi:hypothetical protein